MSEQTGHSADNPVISTLLEVCQSVMVQVHEHMDSEDFDIGIPRPVLVKSQQVVYLLHNSEKENHVVLRGVSFFDN